MLFFLFVKSYAGWEVCGLASHLHVFCFQSEGGSKKFEDWQGLKNFRTGGGSTDFFFEGGGYIYWGGTVPHYMPC